MMATEPVASKVPAPLKAALPGTPLPPDASSVPSPVRWADPTAILLPDASSVPAPVRVEAPGTTTRPAEVSVPEPVRAAAPGWLVPVLASWNAQMVVAHSSVADSANDADSDPPVDAL